MTRTGRRLALRAGLSGAAALAGAAGLRGSHPSYTLAGPALHAQTVALTSATALVSGVAREGVTDLSAVEPGTRIHVRATDAQGLRAVESALLARTDQVAESRGVAATHRDLLRTAALDLHVLSAGFAAPVAGWSQNWRYVWPRDAAHAACALALLGETDRAVTTARELVRLTGEDGWLQARYVPGSSAVPDGRTPQLDGTGWLLWMLDSLRDIPATREAAEELLHRPSTADAIRRAIALLVQSTSPRRGTGATLPPPSPDYWEVSERRTTIATAALTLAGLQRGARLLTGLGDRQAPGVRRRAIALERLLHEQYGPAGYGRYPAQLLRPSPADAGMLFLLPPYSLSVDHRIAGRMGRAERAARRPAGGVAPGAGWKQDGISWTPQTAMFAQAYARLSEQAGAEQRTTDAHRADANRLLTWLAAHRTAAGSLPEKVLADGSPAAVAPLTWTAALVVMTLLG